MQLDFNDMSNFRDDILNKYCVNLLMFNIKTLYCECEMNRKKFEK